MKKTFATGTESSTGINAGWNHCDLYITRLVVLANSYHSRPATVIAAVMESTGGISQVTSSSCARGGEQSLHGRHGG